MQLPPRQSSEGTYVYDYRVPIEGVEYRYRLVYHERAQEWFFDFGTPDEWILRGERLVIDTPLLWYLRSELNPCDSGHILVLGDTANEGVECDLTALGDRCVLLYVTLDPSAATPLEVVTVDRFV